MKQQSPLNLVIADFLQYIPAPKRQDYELMLLRCNFSDPGDPLFPIMLFLLFLQDSLADRSDTLADEFCKLRTALENGQPLPEQPKKRQWWKIGAIALLSIQIIMGAFGLYQINMIGTGGKGEILTQGKQSSSQEIQKINRYWDRKIENIKDSKSTMNLAEFVSEDMIGIAITVAVIFVGLLLLQIVLILVLVSKLYKSDEDIKDLEDYFQRSLRNASSYDDTGSYLNRFYEPEEPIIEDDQSDVSEPDIRSWSEVEPEGSKEENIQTEGDKTL